jgi:hypothetical protein
VGDDLEVGLMPEFLQAGTGKARLLLDDAETDVIRRLTAELRAVLGAPVDSDPVLDRLFPSAYEDATEEAKYRDLIGDDLLTYKLEALDVVSASLGDEETDVTLADETLDAWLACLTDLRLALGIRLEVDEESMARDINPRDPNAQSLAMLHWLGWVQEGVLRACG